LFDRLNSALDCTFDSGMYLERLDGNEVLFEKVVDQIEKDFGSYWTVESTVFQTPEVLRTQVIESVLALLEDSPRSFMNLCYRVDLPELMVSPILYSNDLELLEKGEKLGELILDREVQKVWTRMHYSG
jgi:hypothetical protein